MITKKMRFAAAVCCTVLLMGLGRTVSAGAQERVEEYTEAFHMTHHEEGGWFSEVYTAPELYATENGDRALAGSIYYLLEPGARSAFHQIDCDELWYYHDGCGMKLYIFYPDGSTATVKLGKDINKGERPMVVITRGAIFAAENIREKGFTLISCMTTPKFKYEGWRLVGKTELMEKYPQEKALIGRFFD